MYTLSSREKQDYDDGKNNNNNKNDNNNEDADVKSRQLWVCCAQFAHAYRTAGAAVALTRGERGRKTKGFFLLYLTDKQTGIWIDRYRFLGRLCHSKGSQVCFTSFKERGILGKTLRFLRGWEIFWQFFWQKSYPVETSDLVSYQERLSTFPERNLTTVTLSHDDMSDRKMASAAADGEGRSQWGTPTSAQSRSAGGYVPPPRQSAEP